MNTQFAIAVLAKRQAKIEVKANLKARGVNTSYIPNREIYDMTNDYLLTHRAELFAVASKQWEQISKPSTKR